MNVAAVSVMLQPTPGTDCLTAPILALGHDYTYTISAGVDQWFILDVPSAGDWRFVTTHMGALGEPGFAVFVGTCPSPLFTLTYTSGTGTCWTAFLFAPIRQWVRFTIASGSATYTFRFEAGHC